MSSFLSRKTRRNIDKTEPLSEQLIYSLIEAALLAPSSCNLQLFKVKVVNDFEQREFLIKNCTRKFDWSLTSIIFFVNSQINYERDAQVVSVGMAIQNLLLRAEELGLNAVPMAGFVGDDKMLEYFGVDRQYKPALAILVGGKERAETVPTFDRSGPQKKRLEEVLIARGETVEPICTSFSIDSWGSGRDEMLYVRQIRSLYFSQSKLVLFRSADDRQEYRVFLDGIQSRFGTLRFLGVCSDDYDSDQSMVDEMFEYRYPFDERDERLNALVVLPTSMFSFAAKEIDVEKVTQYEHIIVFRPKMLGATSVLYYLLKIFSAHVYHRAIFFRFGPWSARIPKRVERKLSRYGFVKTSSEKIPISPLRPLNGIRRYFFNCIIFLFGDWVVDIYQK